MITVSVSDLKTNPAKVLESADDFPVAIQKRNKVAGYVLGRDLYERLVSYIENYLDRAAVNNTDFTKGRDFEKVAQELGI